MNLEKLTLLLKTSGRCFIITTPGDKKLENDEIVKEEDHLEDTEAEVQQFRWRRLEAGVSLYDQSAGRRFLSPVFCTADIPETMLEAFLKVSSDFLGRPRIMSDVSGAFLDFVVVQSVSTDGSAASISSDDASCPSPNPILGKTPSEIHSLWLQNIRPGNTQLSFWSTCTFAILDERTLKDRSVLLCTDHSEVLETVQCDFDIALRHNVPLEVRLSRRTWLTETSADYCLLLHRP